MLEWLLFSPMQMPMETARIFLAVLGMAVASYYDLFNNRNVPEMLLYGFLALAFIFNMAFFDYDVFVYAVVLAFLLLVAGFALYRLGQIGGADVIMVAALVLLLPISPSYLEVPFNYPFIFSVLIFGGAAFAVYSIFFFAGIMARKKTKAKPNYLYLSLLLVYGLFVYLFINAPFFSMAYFAIASVLLLSSIIFLVFRDAIMEATMEQVFVKDLEPEDVVVQEKMDVHMKRMKMGPVLNQRDIDALRKSGTKSVWVYANLPPFLPFLLMGLIISLFFGNQLFLVF
ncbi:MAG: A24 family peptidase [Candidatus ainarchaeum sp.]|nr:A24 family peptidase [Candidatus ainarchaeum sp.]MDD5096100.1 A24 family peptidase [Candidatus ainarchaeum sp.]